MNKTFNLLTAALLLSLSAYSQYQGDVYRQYNNAKIIISGNTTMQLPWTGGVNNPQIAMADLNNDGRKDVVIFEAVSGKATTLIATGNGRYEYDSKYEGSFAGVRDYLQLADFNRDGIADLLYRGFTSSAAIHYGYYVNDVLKFNFYKELKYQTKGGNWNDVHIPNGSLASITDVDGDTDIDIITYDPTGTSIILYQNCQVDDALPNDSIKICLKDWCWGRTIQISQRQQILGAPPCAGFHDPTCKGCGRTGLKGTDGSNTLLLIDMDSDGDYDYFNGHTTFPDIQFFYNGKSQYGVDSAISEDTIWASNGVAMHMPIFPAAFLQDIDHDGDEDLLFTPASENTENYNSISFYENTGTNTNKNFVHRKNNYLVDEMIDLGKISYPVFYDYDKDGRKDLLIGSEGYYQYPANYNRSKIAYYRNTTTTTGSYSFQLQSNDFMGLWASNYRGASLAIGDLDDDGLDDLVIGHTDGTFSFFRNSALSDTLQPVWVLVTDTLKDQSGITIDVGDNAAPAIYDIDNDGKMDIVSGNQFGGLYYFRNNTPTPGNLGLIYITGNLGGINLVTPADPYPYSAPYFGPTDDTEVDYLVIGTRGGRLYRFDGFQNGAMPAQYTMIDSTYSYITGHRNATPAFANIDNDNSRLHEMVLGNYFGGLLFYKQDFKININGPVAGNKEVVVYPNPVGSTMNIKWDKSFNTTGVQVQLVSVAGNVIIEKKFDKEQLSGHIDVSGLSSGIYYCIIQSGMEKTVRPVSILK